MHKKPHSGFVLIELVTTLILIGVIGAFAGLFLYTGVNGFLVSKRNSETALKAQMALDRTSAELRNIKALPKPVFETRKITYQNDIATGNRILQIEDGPQGPGIYLTVGGAKNLLLDNVNVAQSNITYEASKNLDNENNNNEISAIRVTFQLIDMGTPFQVEIYPRALITYP
jgi:prepilin-type N-terminal cleavage/methylation domain-containing protein